VFGCCFLVRTRINDRFTAYIRSGVTRGVPGCGPHRLKPSQGWHQDAKFIKTNIPVVCLDMDLHLQTLSLLRILNDPAREDSEVVPE